jgi:hypothetical protein
MAVISWPVWLALVLFVAAQHGQRGSSPARWVVWTNVAGIVLCATHIVIAMGWVHGWSHAAALEATARQTESVYGLRWGGGVYVNYLFAGVWAFDTWWHSRANRPSNVRWLRLVLRVFYLIVIANAAVVFARPHVRLLGVGLVATLLFAWRPTGPETQAARTAL